VVPPDDAPQVLRPVTVVPIAAGAVVRRPVVSEQTAFPAVDGRMRTDAPVSEQAVRSITQPSRRAPQVGATAAAPALAAVESSRRTSPVDHAPSARAAETTVAYPTGIVVQHEQGIYRPDRPLRVEEYLRFPEPQVDANGEESWTPLYHAKAGR
jgi:hypothetical protein